MHSTYRSTPIPPPGGSKEAKLFVHESLVTGGRDDSLHAFGSASKQEREPLPSAHIGFGRGANTARMILSSASPAELCSAISIGNERLLKGVRGIGSGRRSASSSI